MQLHQKNKKIINIVKYKFTLDVALHEHKYFQFIQYILHTSANRLS